MGREITINNKVELYMQKITVIIILLLLITSKMSAMPNDTIYYECREELSFDTIPYMVKDQAFLDGLNELQLMLNARYLIL